ncbi:MAG: FtsQ-type POTRA domain-containing protein [Bacteroidetes bacterium]|nr:FtsQ-type POTRA domain-containing protein [Bacteroidota bacterium]
MNIKKAIMIFTVISLGALAVLSLNWRSEDKIEKITVSGNYTISREEILNAAHLNDSMTNINETGIEVIQDRISKHPEIKSVFVSRVPPSEIKIEVVEKRPVAILNGDNEMYLLDDGLDVFPYKNFSKMYDLPVISGVRKETNPKSRNKFNTEDLRTALFVILNSYKQSKSLYNNISEVRMSDTSKIIVYLSEDSTPIYFPRHNDKKIADKEYQNELNVKLRILKNYLNQYLAEQLKTKVNYIDLRFRNQIIVNSINQ